MFRILFVYFVLVMVIAMTGGLAIPVIALVAWLLIRRDRRAYWATYGVYEHQRLQQYRRDLEGRRWVR